MKHHGHSGPHDVPLPQTTASAATSPGETPLIERLAAIVPQELALNHDGNPSTMRCACRDCSRDLIHAIIAALDAAEARIAELERAGSPRGAQVSAPLPDPAPLTAEERARLEYEWLAPKLSSSERRALDAIMAALDAAEKER